VQLTGGAGTGFSLAPWPGGLLHFKNCLNLLGMIFPENVHFPACSSTQIRINRRDATEILGAYNLAGNDRKGQLDLATFTKVFGLANTSIPDERDTAARQEMSLTSFYRRQLAEESSYTMPAEEVARRKKDITRYQVSVKSPSSRHPRPMPRSQRQLSQVKSSQTSIEG